MSLIDPDIQRQVDELRPTSLGQRVAMENTLQHRRDQFSGISDRSGPMSEWPSRTTYNGMDFPIITSAPALPQPCEARCCRWRRNILGALVCRLRGAHVLAAGSLSDPWCARCGNAR